MPLTQTRQLIATYGKKLINGTITDDELDRLMDRKSFPKSEGYVDISQPVTDANHSQTNAIDDFVLSIAPQLTPEILHQLTARMIVLAPDQGTNTFMRGTSLEKAFLAYEMVKFPQSAELFLNIRGPDAATDYELMAQNRMRSEYPTPTDIPNLRTVILKPIVELYQQTAEVHYKDYVRFEGQQSVLKNYHHAVYEHSAGRHHAFEVIAAKFTGLKEQLMQLKGDHLKSQILLDFKEELAHCKTTEEVEQLKEQWKNKPEYKVLETGQGLITRIFHLQTSSVKAFNTMIDERKHEIEGEPSASVRL